VAELSLEYRLLKKSLKADDYRYHRMTQSEKMEIITLVEQSSVSVKATLQELGIHRSTFYQWYKRYLASGYDGLADPPYRLQYSSSLLVLFPLHTLVAVAKVDKYPIKLIGIGKAMTLPLWSTGLKRKYFFRLYAMAATYSTLDAASRLLVLIWRSP
jgi:hypothetical protein